MKFVLGAAGVIGLLMIGLFLAGHAAPEASAIPPSITRAPSGPPACDINAPEDPGDGNDDDPSPQPSFNPSSSPFQVDSDISLTDDTGGRDWDGFDHDIEKDDCPETYAPPVGGTDCGDMTATGVYLFDGTDYTGQCFYAGAFTYYVGDPFNDLASSVRSVNIGDYALCIDYPWGPTLPCYHFTGDIPDLGAVGLNNTISSVDAQTNDGYDNNPTPDPAEQGDGGAGAQTAAADANCDGSVGVSDALSVVTFVADANAGCTGSQLNGGLAGDADCSGAVNAVDALQILRQSAGLVSAAC